jgi:hypothetical protein
MHNASRPLVVGLLVAAGLTACGGSGSTASTAPSAVLTSPSSALPTANGVPPQPSVLPTTVPPSSPSTKANNGAAPAGRACATSQLTVSVTDGQGAAGTEYSGITFRNRSASTCTLRGYPGVSLLDRNHQQIGQPAQRDKGSDPIVVMAPGQTATAAFSVGPAACGDALPPASAYLRVFPPDNRDELVISATVLPCAPRIRPVQPGSHLSAS